jgi:hypothetical protein
MADFNSLQAEVDRAVTLGNRAIEMLRAIPGRIQAAVDADNLADNSAVAKLAETLKTENDALLAEEDANA